MPAERERDAFVEPDERDRIAALEAKLAERDAHADAMLMRAWLFDHREATAADYYRENAADTPDMVAWRNGYADGRGSFAAAEAAWLVAHPKQTAGDLIRAQRDGSAEWEEWLRRFAKQRPNIVAPEAPGKVMLLRKQLADTWRMIADLRAKLRTKDLVKDADIARLKAEVAELEQRLALADWNQYGDKAHTPGTMPRETYNAVVKCLHPDAASPSDKQREEACGLFTGWWQASRKS